MVHDIADWKFHDGDDEIMGPREAERLLTEEGASIETIKQVVDIVATISYKGAGVKTEMQTLAGRCVQDADRLDAIGVIGKGIKPGAAWRAFLAKEYAERPQLKECNFQLYGEFLFLPIHLDAEVLADAYPHSLADALNPLDTVLDNLAKAHETIDQLLSSALEHTFAKSTG